MGTLGLDGGEDGWLPWSEGLDSCGKRTRGLKSKCEIPWFPRSSLLGVETGISPKLLSGLVQVVSGEVRGDCSASYRPAEVIVRHLWSQLCVGVWRDRRRHSNRMELGGKTGFGVGTAAGIGSEVVGRWKVQGW